MHEGIYILNNHRVFKYNVYAFFMSLSKLLFGQPGNIREFAEMARPKGESVKVIIEAWLDHNGIFETVEGSVTYSCGNDFNKIGLAKPVGYIPGAGGMWWTGTSMIDYLKNRENQNCVYLENQGLTLNVLEYDKT